MNKTAIYSTILICILLFIFIPHFLFPISTASRFIVLNALWVYFLGNLVLHLKVGLGKEHFEKNPDVFSLTSLVKEHPLLFAALVLNVMLHVYPVVSRTILLHYDESALAQYGLGLFTRAASVFQSAFGMGLLRVSTVFYLVVLVLLVLFHSRLYRGLKAAVRYLGSRPLAQVAAFAVLVLASYAYFMAFKNVPFHQSLYRYAPMSKFLYFMTYTMFGIREFGPRLVQMILGSIAVVYLYRLILLYYGKQTALLGSVIFVFSPLVGYYFNYAELGLGFICAAIMITFYFVRFLKQGFSYDLLLTFLLVGIGFLLKREILLLLPLILAYLFIFRREFTRGALARLGKLVWLSLVPIVPFLIVGRLFSTQYAYDFSRLVDRHIYSYFILLHSQISVALFVLFLISVVYVLARHRNDLSRWLVISSLGYYVFYTLYPFDKIDRFSLAFMPTVAVFLAVLLADIVRRRTLALGIVTVLVAVYLLVISTVVQLPEIQPKFVLYKNLLLEHYPVDQAIKWANANCTDCSIASVGLKNGPFYRDKYAVQRDRFIEIELEEFNQLGQDEMARVLDDGKIGCIVVPRGREPYRLGSPAEEYLKIANFSIAKEFAYRSGNAVVVYSRQH